MVNSGSGELRAPSLAHNVLFAVKPRCERRLLSPRSQGIRSVVVRRRSSLLRLRKSSTIFHDFLW